MEGDVYKRQHSRRYLAQAHKMQIGRLLGMLKAACPEAFFLLTTPPGAYVGCLLYTSMQAVINLYSALGGGRE